MPVASTHPLLSAISAEVMPYTTAALGFPQYERTPWKKANRYAVIDLETTGYKGSDIKIVEIAIVSLDEHGATTDEWVSRIDPGRPIPAEATAVHGISNDDVQGCPYFFELTGEVLARLDGRVIVGHNVSYDVGVLAQELSWASHEIGTPPILCTMKLGRQLKVLGRRKGEATLAAARYALGWGIDQDAHGALGDALTAALVFRELREIAEEEGGVRAIRLLTPVESDEQLALRRWAAVAAANIAPLIDDEDAIAELVTSGMASTPSDLYAITAEQLTENGWTVEAADVLVAAIAASRKLGLVRALVGLGIPGVATGKARAIARAYHSIDQIVRATSAELLAVPEIGAGIAGTVEAFFANPSAKRELAALVSAKVSLDVSAATSGEKTAFSGATVVITGDLVVEREVAQEALIAAGARCTGSVSSKTTVLIQADNCGRLKLEKALQLQADGQEIRILDEAEALALLPAELRWS